jgi:hypothetical protein
MSDKPITKDGLGYKEVNVTDKDNSQVCVLCKESFAGWGNNPEPLAKYEEGVCCDQCDMDKVIPQRIKEHNNGGQV